MIIAGIKRAAGVICKMLNTERDYSILAEVHPNLNPNPNPTPKTTQSARMESYMAAITEKSAICVFPLP